MLNRGRVGKTLTSTLALQPPARFIEISPPRRNSISHFNSISVLVDDLKHPTAPTGAKQKPRPKLGHPILTPEYKHNIKRVAQHPNMVDPISVLTLAMTTGLAIKNWIEARGEKEETLANMSETVSRLSHILDILQPKVESQSDNTLLTLEVLQLGSILTKTLEHLSVWKPRKLNMKRVINFVKPTTVTLILQADERRISQQVIMILFALSITSYIKGMNNDQAKPNALKWIRNLEVAHFWDSYVGREVIQ
jgi:hypothetical protein